MYTDDSKVILKTAVIFRESEPQENGGILTMATSYNLDLQFTFS